MGKVTVKANVTVRYSQVDRDRTAPEDLEHVVRRKIEDALDPEGAELTIDVKAEDG